MITVVCIGCVLSLHTHTSWSFSPFADIAYVNERLDNTATYHHTKTALANQGRDEVIRTGRFWASGHLLNDVCRQQCCWAPSSLNYCSVFRTLEWVYRCTVSRLMPLHTAAPRLLQQSLSGVHVLVGENERLSKCIEILGSHFPAFFPPRWPQLYLTAYLAPSENRREDVSLVCQLSVVPCCLPESPAGVQRPCKQPADV